jgi:hypothetical protein
MAMGCSPKNVGGMDAGSADASGEAATEASTDDVDKACGDSAYAKCSRLQACSPTLVTLRYGDLPTCEASMKAFCLAALAAPSQGQTVAGLEACVGAMNDWACADYIVEANPPPECAQPTGSVAVGSACAFAGQCQTGYCSVANGAPCGTCAPAPKAGDPCASILSCGMGLQCNAVSQTCDAVAAHLAPCAPGQPCVLGDECVGSNSSKGTPGTCQTAVETPGAACSSSTAECDFYRGLTCSGSGTCVAVQFASGGQACGFVAAQNVDVRCVGSQNCPSTTGDAGTAPTCPSASPVGGPCDLAAGPGCVDLSECIVTGGGTAGTCRERDGTACH